MKKIIWICTVLVLTIATSAGTYFYLDSRDSGSVTSAVAASAEDMRLEKYLGTVTLSNDGEEKEVITGARLISGDDLETLSESNAYVMLDQSKILVVDEISNIEIQENGKALEVEVLSGSVFFNVTEPLTAEESLDFRTNNIVTGVRGTSGIITYEKGSRTSQVVVLSGVVEVASEEETVVITAGQAAVATTLEDGTVEMEVIAYEKEEIALSFTDFFIDELQLDLTTDSDAFSFADYVRESYEGEFDPLLYVTRTDPVGEHIETVGNTTYYFYEYKDPGEYDSTSFCSYDIIVAENGRFFDQIFHDLGDQIINEMPTASTLVDVADWNKDGKMDLHVSSGAYGARQYSYSTVYFATDSGYEPLGGSSDAPMALCDTGISEDGVISSYLRDGWAGSGFTLYTAEGNNLWITEDFTCYYDDRGEVADFTYKAYDKGTLIMEETATNIQMTQEEFLDYVGFGTRTE